MPVFEPRPIPEQSPIFPEDPPHRAKWAHLRGRNHEPGEIMPEGIKHARDSCRNGERNPEGITPRNRTPSTYRQRNPGTCAHTYAHTREEDAPTNGKHPVSGSKIAQNGQTQYNRLYFASNFRDKEYIISSEIFKPRQNYCVSIILKING